MPTRDHVYLLLLAAAALIGLNPYTFGVYNHYVTLPFFLDLQRPELFPGDALIAERAHFFTWFLAGLEGLSRVLRASPQAVFFGVHAIAVTASVFTFYRLGLALFDRREPALYATLLFVFGIKVLGGVATFEALLMERTLALPVELLALRALVRARWVRSLSWAGLAFLIHPLSAIYVAAMIGFAALLALREIGPARFATAIAAFLLVASPSLYLKFTSDAPSMTAFSADAGWLGILRLRSAHHVFPSTWPVSGWIFSALFVFGLIRIQREFWPEARHRRAGHALIAVGLMAIAGTFFSEVWPAALPIQFQFWRSFRFLAYFGMLYAAWRMWRATAGEHSWGDGLVTVATTAALWGAADLPKQAGVIAVLIALFPVSRILVDRFGLRERSMEGILVGLVAVLGVAGFMQRGFLIESAQAPDWRAAQAWARTETPIDAGFIVPPNRWGFRVESERTIWGDWNDGTQNFFNPVFGAEWLVRMKMLGFDGDPARLGAGYRSLDQQDFEAIAARMPENREVYAVLFADQVVAPTEGGGWDSVWSNDGYRIVRVR